MQSTGPSSADSSWAASDPLATLVLAVTLLVVAAPVVSLAAVAPASAAGASPAPGVSASPAPVSTTDPARVTALRSPGDGGPDDPRSADNASGSHPKVQDSLLPDDASGSGDGPTTASADRVTVVVRARPGAGDRVADLGTRYGDVGLRHGDLVEVDLPRSAIVALAENPAVAYVREPIDLQEVGDPGTVRVGDGTAGATAMGTAGDALALSTAGYGSVTSDGVATIRADDAQAAGYTGEDVTIAVFDLGFDPDHPEIAGRVVWTEDFSGSGTVEGSNTDHGTAAAEIALDVAPDANLVLVRVETYLQLLSAVDWIDSTEVDVVSMSLGFDGGLPLDGTSRLDRKLDRSVGGGTLWSVSAGNEGDGDHWHGRWRDGDGDGVMNFTGSDERLGLTAPLSVTVQWDDWGDTDQNYDLFLVDGSGDVVASSTDAQGPDSGDRPVERISCTSSCVGGERYYLVIERVDADGDADFDAFFSSNVNAEHWTAGRSVLVPATARRATAVGAVRASTGELEAFSSRGPTKDGRTKPDLVGPDGVRTATYDHRFYGTSAAAPHVAGAAALVLDADPGASTGAVERRLRRPVERGEPSNRAGYGLVDLRAAIVPTGPTGTAFAVDRINGTNQDSVPVDVAFSSPPDGGDVVVRLAGPDGGTVTGRAAADTDARSTRVTVDASSLADGNVTATAKVVDGLGNENPAGFTAGSGPVPKDGSPSISNYQVGNPSGTELTVRFDASEALSAIDVAVTDVSGSTVVTLDGSDFARSGTTYAATVDLGGAGTYTATLRSATDDDGNDGADGQSATVQVGSVDDGDDSDGTGDDSTSDGSGSDGTTDDSTSDGSDSDGTGDDSTSDGSDSDGTTDDSSDDGDDSDGTTDDSTSDGSDSDGTSDDSSGDGSDSDGSGDESDPVTVAPAPGNVTIATGEERTVSLSVEGTTDGIGAYDLRVAVDDPAVVEIRDVATVGDDGDAQTYVFPDGDRAAVSGTSNATTGNGSDVALLTVTVEAVSAGNATLSVTVEELTDRNGDSYDAATGGGAIVVRPASGVDVTDDGNRSASVDGDPVHEDVDGDGDFDVFDVAAFFEAVSTDDPAVAKPSLFDLDGDGEVDVFDVVVLFEENTGG